LDEGVSFGGKIRSFGFAFKAALGSRWETASDLRNVRDVDLWKMGKISIVPAYKLLRFGWVIGGVLPLP
jgi:hypothetical protein